MRYLITFSCYGSRLHGDEAGSVDRNHNLPGSRLLEPDPKRRSASMHLMKHPAYLMDSESRSVVLAAFREVCSHHRWPLFAAHVRTNHVHVVVESEARPEKIMQALKSYASRKLSELRGDQAHRTRWTRHGSTRWLPNDQDVANAITYVVQQQGDAMALFVADSSVITAKLSIYSA